MNAQMKLCYTANPGLSALKVTPQQIKAKDLGYPYLKRKAAQARHVAPFALTLARRHAYGDATREAFAFADNSPMVRCTEEYRRHVVDLFEALELYYESIHRDEFDPDECKGAIYRYSESLESLNRLWRADVPPEAHGTLPWHIRPTRHLLQHLAEDQLHKWGSPRRFWCYNDESFVGAIKNVAGRSRHPATLESVVMAKMQLFAGVEAHVLE